MRSRQPGAPRLSRMRWIAALVLGTGVLAGCAPLVLGGAVVGGMMATDRRTSGAQVEDQGIELKAANRLGATLGERAHVNATSYNRTVLLTGEVANDADRATAEQIASQIENVRATVNELVVAPLAPLSARSNDVVLTSKVKASFIDAADVQANAVKVVTERGTVYLLGRVTEREAKRATEIARSVPGVRKVVRVFELVSEAELANQLPRPTAAK